MSTKTKRITITLTEKEAVALLGLAELSTCGDEQDLLGVVGYSKKNARAALRAVDKLRISMGLPPESSRFNFSKHDANE